MPRGFDQAAADEICDLLMSGQSIRAICRDAGDRLPSQKTIFRWLAANEDFARQYATARQVQADVMFDEIQDIADTPRRGLKTVRKGTGDKAEVETTEADMIEHRRLQIDARKWILARMNPRKYGDKILNEHTGADGGPVTLEAMIMASYKKEAEEKKE